MHKLGTIPIKETRWAPPFGQGQIIHAVTVKMLPAMAGLGSNTLNLIKAAAIPFVNPRIGLPVTDRPMIGNRQIAFAVHFKGFDALSTDARYALVIIKTGPIPFEDLGVCIGIACAMGGDGKGQIMITANLKVVNMLGQAHG